MEKQANILKERIQQHLRVEGHVQKGGGGDEGTERVNDIRSEIRPLGVKDLKCNGVKAVQLKLKATAGEPKKINEAKNGGFEVQIFGKSSVHKAPTEEN